MIELLSEEEFNRFSSMNEQGTFFQTSYWGELKSLTGWVSHLVGIKQDDEIIAASLLLGKKIPILNKYIYYAPRGFLIDYNNTNLLKKFVKEIYKYVRKNKGIFIKINPYFEYRKRNIDGKAIDEKTNQHVIDLLDELGFKHNGFVTTYGTDLEPRWLSVLDLHGKTEEELLSNMRPTTRWSINNSYKHGLKLVEIDENNLIEFKKLMEHTGERRGFIDRPLVYYEQMYNVFKKEDNIKIMLVELDVKEYLDNLNNQKHELQLKQVEIKSRDQYGKKTRALAEYQSQIESLQERIEVLNIMLEEKGPYVIVAGGLFMTFGNQVISLFGASYKEYMKFNAQYFLNFKMILYALNNGYEKYNFYGITGEFNENSEMFGLFDFKRGFDSNVVELLGEFTLITNKLYNKIYEKMFDIYRKLKKKRVKK
ncbi:MAG: peptidoglycan bridge formation glycyltransferase FemA/FemB family protein [Bacilli bacterium]|nr:peptidoglycan bridge formation glycyltransferase FemA/FemB family protein [Bacilli bacterium]